MEYEDASDLTSGVLGRSPKENRVRANYFCIECGTYWTWSPFEGLDRWAPFDIVSAAMDERSRAEMVEDAIQDLARLHLTREIRAELDEKTEEVVA